MSVRIINYTDITKLDKLNEFNIIKDTLHICAASSTTEAMYKHYGQNFNEPIISVGNITKNLVGKWDSSIVKLGQYTNLTRIIKELTEEYSQTKDNFDEYRLLLRGFRRNQKEVLKSIRSLIECNIYPEYFECQSIEEYIFKDIWSMMEVDGRDQSILAFRNDFYYNLNNKDVFANKLLEGINSAIDYEIKKSKDYPNIKIKLRKLPKKIILHGFYYITPIQDKIIRLIQNIGIDIIYLNWIDNKYPKIFEIWDKTFDEEFGYPKKTFWINEDNKENYRWCDLFASIYEGNITEDEINKVDKSSLDIKSYDNIISFVKDYREKDRYFSPASNNINDILKDYYPERYDSKHLLSYPIGQYLYQLHTMWDEDQGYLILDFNSIQQCFSSGWISVEKHGKKINARDYTYDLYCIKNYFKDCSTMEDWKKRLELLKFIKKNIVSNLDTDVDMENKNYRFHEMASNPFSNFSFFKVDIDRIEDIFSFINKLIRVAEYLFKDNEETSLENYFNKLDKIIENNNFDFINQLEKDIVNEIRKKLTSEVPYEINCFPEDIAEALILFLGGEFNQVDEEEIDIDKRKIIEPLEKVESSSIICNEEGVIHICQVSEEDIPGNDMGYSWPLNSNNLNRINLNNEESSRLLQRMKLIVENKNCINRYLFYCSLHCEKKIRLSWIKNLDEKILEESIFIKLLKTWVKDLNDKTEEDEVIIGDKKDIIIEKKENIDRQNIKSMLSECDEEFKICPRKFYYSYIADDFPTYTSDFHHKFGFTRMVSAIYTSSNKKIDVVYNSMKDLFPQWRDIEKMQLKEYIYPSANCSYEEYDGNTYTNARKYIHFLKPRYKEFECKDIDIYQNSNPVIFKAIPENGDKCLYCCHCTYCKEAILPLDRVGDE